jgi:hypothetical protein
MKMERLMTAIFLVCLSCPSNSPQTHVKAYARSIKERRGSDKRGNGYYEQLSAVVLS